MTAYISPDASTAGGTDSSDTSALPDDSGPDATGTPTAESSPGEATDGNTTNSGSSSSPDMSQISGNLLLPDGAPFAHGLVYLYRVGPDGDPGDSTVVQSTTTDAKGFYVFSNVPPGSYVVKPQGNATVSFPTPVTPVSPGDTVPTIVGSPPVNTLANCTSTDDTPVIANSEAAVQEIANFALQKLNAVQKRIGRSRTRKAAQRALAQAEKRIRSANTSVLGISK